MDIEREFGRQPLDGDPDPVQDMTAVSPAPDGGSAPSGRTDDQTSKDSLDTILRTMSEEDPLGWAKSAAQLAGLPEPTSAVLATTDLAAVSIRADRVLLVDEGATVVHIEFQRAAEPDFPLRMLDYYVRLRRFHRRPVIQVVVVTGGGASIPSEVEMDAHSVRFVVLRPGDFDADFFLNTVPALAVFARHTEPDVEFLTATLKKIAELGRSAQNVLGTSDIGYAIALAKHRFAPSVIDSIQRLDGMSIAEFIADTPPGRELLERGMEQGRGEGLEQGLERGLEQGLERGLEQGRGEGMAALLELQLGHKFGPLSDTDRQLLHSLGRDGLTELGIEWTSLASLADVREWMLARSLDR